MVCGCGGFCEVDWLEDWPILGPIRCNGMAWGFYLLAYFLTDSF